MTIHKKRYDVIWILGDGIGNVIQALYSVEYCLRLGLRVGVYLENLPSSFIEYLKVCYGKIILEEIEYLNTTNLIHCWLIKTKKEIEYENYYYVNPDKISTQYQSETESYLSIAKALYPSGSTSKTLKRLILKETERVSKLGVEAKIVLYPGCSADSPVQRWPYNESLLYKLRMDNCLIIGGLDDLNFEASYYYLKIFSEIMPQRILNRKLIWSICKAMGLLKKHSHINNLVSMGNSYFNEFSWTELAFIFSNCKGFIGNDGGLSHFGSALGAKGLVIFGPSSVEKSSYLNKKIKTISRSFDCQPCFYSKGGPLLYMAKTFINCPYQIKCLYDINVKEILYEVKRFDV